MFRQFDRLLCKEAGGVMPNQGFRFKAKKFINLVNDKYYHFRLSSLIVRLTELIGTDFLLLISAKQFKTSI